MWLKSVVTEAVKYYSKNGSKVFCAFLDANKILLNGLLAKLIKRNVPLKLRLRYAILSVLFYHV